MLLFNRACDTEKLQKLQNRRLHMCFDIKNLTDKTIKSLHEDAENKYLDSRRSFQLSKIMYNLAAKDKFRKVHDRHTRAMDGYVFNTNVVKLSIYANSPYYKGVQLWNDLPADIKTTDDKRIFDYRIKRHF